MMGEEEEEEEAVGAVNASTLDGSKRRKRADA